MRDCGRIVPHIFMLSVLAVVIRFVGKKRFQKI